MLINVYTIYTGPLSVQAQFSRLFPISSSFHYNGSLVTWTVVCLTVAKLKPLILSMPGFTLPNITNIFVITILYHFCLLPAQFCYIIIHALNFESLCWSRTGVRLGNSPMVRRTFFCRRCNFITWVSAANSQAVLKVKVKVTLRLTVSQSVGLGFEPNLELMTRCFH
jgi:hypothetical protein